ncbi:hypothetical protein BT67DRAFT_443377, partial [Trichocladium antarcticum]
MPPIDTEGQFKFLLCCIKHSAAGKVSRRCHFPRSQDATLQRRSPPGPRPLTTTPQVNFVSVAEELSI